MNDLNLEEKQALEQERNEVLRQWEDWLEMPMLILALLWLLLFIIELVRGLTPILDAVSTTIWIIFILDFLLEFSLAPRKVAYLRRNWLTALSLLLPALRIFRIFRVLRTVRAVRGLQLLRVMSRTNQGMKALAATVHRRGFGYVLGLTIIVTLMGAAGMYAFENQLADPSGLKSYGNALWWTAMLITTMGSEYSPKTAEGRVLTFLLALYASAVFGYVTATIATFFIGRDADSEEGEIAGAKSIVALQKEIVALRQEIQTLVNRDSN